MVRGAQGLNGSKGPKVAQIVQRDGQIQQKRAGSGSRTVRSGERDGQIWGAGRPDLRETRGGRGRGGGFSLQGHALARYSRSLRDESIASLVSSCFLSSAG